MSNSISHNILFVDDESDILELMHTLFTMQGWRVFTAERIEQAEKIVAEENVEIIVCDHFLGEQMGVLWLEKLRASGNKAHFIVYTGCFDIQAACFPELGDDYTTVIKTDFKALESAIHTAANLRRLKVCS